MNTTKIIITNVLLTDSAFAVFYDDHKKNVFIPSKVAGTAHLSVGDVVDALIIPNMQHQEKTPWLAARIIASTAYKRGELSARIVDYLTEYDDATSQELADTLGESESVIEDELNDMARGGYLIAETIYSLMGAE